MSCHNVSNSKEQGWDGMHCLLTIPRVVVQSTDEYLIVRVLIDMDLHLDVLLLLAIDIAAVVCMGAVAVVVVVCVRAVAGL